MEIAILGLQNAGKTTLVNLISVCLTLVLIATAVNSNICWFLTGFFFREVSFQKI